MQLMPWSSNMSMNLGNIDILKLKMLIITLLLVEWVKMKLYNNCKILAWLKKEKKKEEHNKQNISRAIYKL